MLARTFCCLLVGAIAIGADRGRTGTLDMYFIDVEGGQATLLVAPGGETLLVDAGFPGDGTFQAKPGDPRAARDPQRIAAVARTAGVTKLDSLLVTHFHADHMGGVVELAQLLRIDRFIDHGTVPPEAETNVPGTLAMFAAYSSTRATRPHTEPTPGDKLPLNDVEVTVVSTDASTIAKPLSAGGRVNPACEAQTELAPQEPHENPRSTGILVQFGAFRFLDVGDLTGRPLHALACPTDLIGPVSVYLVAHHGGADAADSATFAAFAPQAAVLNNGSKKGGDPEIFSVLRRSPRFEDVWQLHRSTKAGAENFPDGRIANLDETTAHWLKVSARRDGSFQVVNERTRTVKRYDARP